MTDNLNSTRTIAHLPTRTLRELDHFGYKEKLRHWTRKDAWSPGGAQLRFENPNYRIGDVRVVDGNVVRAKPLIGRPCFGVPTALLRYEHATRYVKGRGQLPTGRCNGCKAKDACRWVVDNRLRSSPAIKAAWTEWLQSGGPNSFSSSGFKDMRHR